MNLWKTWIISAKLQVFNNGCVYSGNRKKNKSCFEEGTLRVCGCGVFIWHWLQQHLPPGLFLICSYPPAVWHLCLKIGKFLCAHLAGGTSLTDLKVAPFPGPTLRKHFNNKSNYLPRKSWMIPLCSTSSTSAAAVSETLSLLCFFYIFFVLISAKELLEAFLLIVHPKLSFHLLFMGASAS